MILTIYKLRHYEYSTTKPHFSRPWRYGRKSTEGFQKRLFQEFTPEERAKLPIGFLYVDTTDEMMHPGDKSWYVLGENAQFNANEFLFIKGIQLEQIFANPSELSGSERRGR